MKNNLTGDSMILVPLKLVEETCETFAFYANNHYAKGTPEGDEKGKANEAMSDKWGAALIAGVTIANNQNLS